MKDEASKLEISLGSDEPPASRPGSKVEEPKTENQAALEALEEFFSKGKAGDFAGAHEAWQDYQALCEEA